jgi:RND family efflux transporter MFP subunit
VDDVNVQDQPVKVVSVQSNLKEPVREFPGRVAASESANVASKVAGQVIAIHFQAGDEIKAGDLLLEIDQTDYQLALEQAQANYNLAKVSFERVKTSREQNIATQANFDNAQANFEQTRVGLKQAQNQIDNTKITAPFDGAVVRVSPKLYDFVATAQPLVYVQSTTNIDVKFQVPSDIVARLSDRDAQNNKVDVIFDALPDQVFKADVKEFSADSDRSTRSFDVTLTLKSPPTEEANLLPGMDATVLVDLSQIDDAPLLTVPSHTVFKQGQANYVWVVSGNKVTKTEVTLGGFVHNNVVVLSGLNENDRVVAAGIHKLVDQQTVSVWSGE